MLKGILGTIRDLYTYRYFHNRDKAPRNRGVFPSYHAAESALPKDEPKGFDLDTVPGYFIENEPMLNPADYPVLVWLSQILEPDMTVFDFGGGFGQCYYCYQNYIRFPPGLRWIVCDLESFVRRGSEVARERNVPSLSFTSDRQRASDAQIYLSSGALHYLEPDLSEMLAPLPTKPEHIVINRVPMYGGEPYYTMQNTKHSYSLNKVMNESQFVRGLENLGYRQIDSWKSPRSLHVPFHPERFVPNFRGFYFRKQR